MDKKGRAIYKDPVTVKSEKLEEIERKFSFYEVVSIIQQKTHLTFSEISEIFEANKIDRNTLVDTVNKNYLVIYGIANQILSQAIKYEEKEEIIEEELELTKAFPFKINVKKELQEENEEAFTRNLVVYKEQEEKDGRTSNLGFHVNPYNFDSSDELELFHYLRSHLNQDEFIRDIYFTGGITNEKHNEFFFDYEENLTEGDQKFSKYFPDFLIETSKGRYLVIEVKGGDKELTYKREKELLDNKKLSKDKITSNPLMKEVGFTEFKKLNSNFDYHIIFNGTILQNQEKVIEKIKSLK
ncbi:hypothetical protein KKC45_02060 [Patescibacteria group bacterium]|nr:hypothetical protein [Patescibacteria group bacterium]